MQKQQDNSFDWLVKLLIIGDSGVGKTNILLRFVENNFHPSHLTTIGIDFKIKTIEIDAKKLKLQIWDTAGQERFKTITQTYYKGAMGIILTYAINNKESFTNIQNWMSQIKTHANENVVKILVANKCDTSEREVEYDQGKSLADSFGIPFFEVSAKEGKNINEIFYAISKIIKEKLLSTSNPTPENGSKLENQAPNEKKNKNCC